MLLHERQKATKNLILERSIPEPNSGCWLWLGHLNMQGYGEVQAEYPGLTSKWLAHRLSYFLFKANLDKSLMIMHICHNKCCVNPDHLFQGTAQQNSDSNKRRWA